MLRDYPGISPETCGGISKVKGRVVNSHDVNGHDVNSHDVNSHDVNSHDINDHVAGGAPQCL